MSVSILTTSIGRLLVGSILAMLLLIGMALPAWAMTTTATRGTGIVAPGASTSAVFQLSYTSTGENLGQLSSGPPDPGCQGANANNPICQNSSGGTG